MAAEKPLSVDQALSKARRHAQKGEVRLAEHLYRSVLARFPNNGRALAGLKALDLTPAGQPSAGPSRDQIQGLIALYGQGRLQEALARGQALAGQFPASAILQNVLGVISAGLGRLDEAVQCYTRALQLMPGYPEALNNLGNALRDLGQTESALASYGQALQISPGFAQAHNNLGNALRDLGRRNDAAAEYERALEIIPSYAEAHNNLGSLCFDAGEHARAIACYERALEIRPAYPEAHNNLGIVLRELGRHDAAVASYTEALRLRPGYAVAHNNLGNALRDLGRNNAAAASYREALRIKPDLAEAHYTLGTLTKYQPGDPRIADMLAQVGNLSLPAGDRALLCFALGKAHDDLGETGRAFGYFEEGNRLRKQELGYDIGADEALFARIKALFAAGNLPDLAAAQSPAGRGRRPIFIVGMPRSGTTLVEQILASHSQVFGAGELRALAQAALPVLGDARGGGAGALTPGAIRQVRDSYLAELNALAGGAPVVTDKMPLNFRWIGFILTALPEARVIHLRRDPVATCWSVYRQYFSATGNGYAYDLTDIARYFRLYAGLMEFWRETFPGRIHDLDYEALTEQQETETRKLLDYCGLDWEDACLDFHRTERTVKTVSALQVRQGMYRGSSEAWRKYEAHLQPLIQALGEHARGR